MAQFNSYLDILDLSDAIDYCRLKGEYCLFKKDEAIVQEGEMAKYGALVLSGYFKLTVTTQDGEERVVNFTFPGQMIMDFYCSVHGNPAQFSVVAGTNSEVLLVPLKDLKPLLSQNYLFEYKSLFMMAFSRLSDLYRQTPAQRYEALMKNYPHIIESISLKDIASFLMVTPTHLSRIRRQYEAAH